MTNYEKADNLFGKAESLLSGTADLADAESYSSTVARHGLRGLKYAEPTNCPALFARSTAIIQELKRRAAAETGDAA